MQITNYVICPQYTRFPTTEAIKLKYGFKDGRKLHYFLGILVEQDEVETYIHQTKYCTEVLETIGFGNAHGSATPMETKARFSKRIEPPEHNCIDFEYRELLDR